LLIRRSHIGLLAIAALAFPATALAATLGGSERVGLADATVAPLALERSSANFKDLVADVAADIRSKEAARVKRKQREQREAFSDLPGGVSIETLEAIAACESGGDPTIVSADGSYRGKYQFSFSTWESVGGSGDPAAAPEAEQDYRAALLYSVSGSSPWPVCGL
jgi:Transglycosylase-like domain